MVMRNWGDHFIFGRRNNLLHPDIWKTYFKNIDHKKYNIYSHSKDPLKVDPFLNPIKNQIPTKWGTLSIVKATLNLLKTVSKIRTNHTL